CCLFYCLYFFFFQAEDGIRDKLVTGVQTCALPISVSMGLLTIGTFSRICRVSQLLTSTVAGSSSLYAGSSSTSSNVMPRYSIRRSEERRVGKECRYGW